MSAPAEQEAHVPRRGGPEKCPRPCTECPEGEHHFSDAMIDFSDGGEDHEDAPDPVRAQATAAGCDAWYICKHCDAWEEYLDEDDDFGESEGLDDDLGPEEHDVDEEGPGRYSTRDR